MTIHSRPLIGAWHRAHATAGPTQRWPRKLISSASRAMREPGAARGLSSEPGPLRTDGQAGLTGSDGGRGEVRSRSTSRPAQAVAHR